MRVYPKFCLFGNNLTKPYNHAYAVSLKFVRVTHGDYLVHSGYLANQFPKTIQYHIPSCLHFQVQKFKQPFIANRKKRGTRFIHVSKSKNDLRERERERELCIEKRNEVTLLLGQIYLSGSFQSPH